MKTIPDLFEDSVEKYGDSIYLWEKPDDHYVGTTYKETKELVYRFCAGLMSLGINKGDRLALLSEGRNKWAVTELGIAYAGAVNVPLSIKLDSSEILFRLKHSNCCIVVASSGQLSKIREIKKGLPGLKKVILTDTVESYEADEIYFDDVLSEGKTFLENNYAEFENRYKSVGENDIINICYTSGTTADPKGIMLSHRNYYTNVFQATELFDVPPYHLSLMILPWDHAFAHTVGLYALMKSGASLASVQPGKTANETLKNIPVNIKEIKPTFLLSVPALAKNFRKNVERGIRAKGVLTEKLFNHALKIAYAYNGNGWNKGKGFRNKLNKILYLLYDKIIFKKVREGFGGKLEFFVGGGALLEIELQKFFYAIGIPMLQGYGLTEATPIISANTLGKYKFGSSGLPVPDMELKICDEDGIALPAGQKGEIVVKGDNVMPGYWKNETATAETIKDGWLYTGDLGYLDSDGFLYVLGRFKSLLISGDGEKYSPEGIEEAIAEDCRFIDQIMLHNNQSPYTTALVFPAKDELLNYLKKHHYDPVSDEGITKALELILSEINQYFTGGKFQGMFPERWLPSATGLISEGFTEQNKMMNSTMKIVRNKIEKNHSELINFIYSPEAKNFCNIKNKEALKKLFCT